MLQTDWIGITCSGSTSEGFELHSSVSEALINGLVGRGEHKEQLFLMVRKNNQFRSAVINKRLWGLSLRLAERTLRRLEGWWGFVEVTSFPELVLGFAAPKLDWFPDDFELEPAGFSARRLGQRLTAWKERVCPYTPAIQSPVAKLRHDRLHREVLLAVKLLNPDPQAHLEGIREYFDRVKVPVKVGLGQSHEKIEDNQRQVELIFLEQVTDLYPEPFSSWLKDQTIPED